MSSSNLSPPPPPPEDEWIRTYLKFIPGWQSLPLSHQLWIFSGQDAGLLWLNQNYIPHFCSNKGIIEVINFLKEVYPGNYLGSMIPISISRVNQFDAARLDIEMSAMLKEQMVKVFSLMKRFSIWVDKPTPGNALMNLRYRDERAMDSIGKVRIGLEGPGLTIAQKIWYWIATAGGQYTWARLQSFSAFRAWGDSEQRPLARHAWILIQRIEGLYKAASFGNLLIFLYTGKFRNLIERVLQARLVCGSPNMNRAVSFEYMNRQLVWNEFSEMLLLLLPLLNSSSMKKLLSPFSKEKSSSSKVDDSCPICQAIPAIPFLALPCQHRYCHFCLSTRCAAATSFRCRCGEPVVAMQRHGG